MSMYGNTQNNSLDFNQSGGINKQRKIPFGFGQTFETPEDDYSGMNIYSRPSIEKEQYQYYNQHNSLSDPSFFGSVPNNAMGNNTMLPPLINSATNTGTSINRLSHTGLMSRPQQQQQQQQQQQGIGGSHNSFPMSQVSPVIGSPSRGSGVLMGTHGSGPGMIGMGMSVGKPNMRLGGVGISQPGNFPGGLSSIDSTSPNIDISDFPTLRGMGLRRDIPQSLPSNQPLQFPHNPSSQMGFHNQHQMHSVQTPQAPEPVAEFQMHHEDFPALPGLNTDANHEQQNSVHSISNSNPANAVITPGPVTYQTKLNTNLTTASTNFSTVASTQLNSNSEIRNTLHYDLAPGSGKDRIITIPTPIGPPNKSTKDRVQDGVAMVSIPEGMVRNQFGMFGLLTFIRAAETDNKLVSLALGSDLTTLGLNLNSPESLFASFSSPWSDTPARPQDIDYNVPQEYIINLRIRDKLAPIRLNKYGDELLFYLYYNNGNDILQMYANYELQTRNWRYHKDEKVWIMKAQGIDPITRSHVHEQGTYAVFDVKQFKKVHREMTIEYSKLEERHYSNMNIPPHNNNNNNMYTYPKPDLN